jgi:hypothetical protein
VIHKPANKVSGGATNIDQGFWVEDFFYGFAKYTSAPV